MSFPDVPYDETLFESNELMRNYWENATQKRSAVDTQETIDELYDLSIASFNEDQVLRLSTVEDSLKDKNVEPKIARVIRQVTKVETPVKEPTTARGEIQYIQLDPKENDNRWFMYLGIVAVLTFLLYQNNKFFIRY